MYKKAICISDLNTNYGDYWIKGLIYEYDFVTTPDKDFGFTRPWAVLHKTGLARLSDSNFKEHFQDLNEIREIKINILIDGNN